MSVCVLCIVHCTCVHVHVSILVHCSWCMCFHSEKCVKRCMSECRCVSCMSLCEVFKLSVLWCTFRFACVSGIICVVCVVLARVYVFRGILKRGGTVHVYFQFMQFLCEKTHVPKKIKRHAPITTSLNPCKRLEPHIRTTRSTKHAAHNTQHTN